MRIHVHPQSFRTTAKYTLDQLGAHLLNSTAKTAAHVNCSHGRTPIRTVKLSYSPPHAIVYLFPRTPRRQQHRQATMDLKILIPCPVRETIYKEMLKKGIRAHSSHSSNAIPSLQTSNTSPRSRCRQERKCIVVIRWTCKRTNRRSGLLPMILGAICYYS